MYREELGSIGSGYKVVSPIFVEVAASLDNSGKIYSITVIGLKNELVFGIGRTKGFAFCMLRQLLIDYYEKLMSSDLNKYNGVDFINYRCDKAKLQRSIKKIESTT